jgi:hypothetical protein
VQATTDLGAILVEVPRGTAYAVDAATSVGGAEITVDRDPSSAHKIRVQTNVGGMEVKAVQ